MHEGHIGDLCHLSHMQILPELTLAIRFHPAFGQILLHPLARALQCAQIAAASERPLL